MPEHQQTQQSTESKSTVKKQAISLSQTPASNPFSIIQRAKINPKSLTYADVMQLQRTIGNRAVGMLLTGIGNTSTVQQAPVQRQETPEDEETCPSCMQRQKIPEEEEPLQSKMTETVQRQGIPEEEEPFQMKRENNTGMPDNLKAGVENFSGLDMSDVRVHYNSDKPAQAGAFAYTQGTDIHVAPGQERHLSHEAWHVVQQAQGRVQPKMQLKEGVPVNDDQGLEHEADVIGEVAATGGEYRLVQRARPVPAMQRVSSGVPEGKIPLNFNASMAVRQTVVQRMLEGGEKQGQQIKIWDEYEQKVQTVYFFAQENDTVYYSTNKIASKAKKKGLATVASKFAFPMGYKDSQIKAEIQLQGDAEAKMKASDLTISEEVIDFLIKQVVAYAEKKEIELEVQLTKERIQFAISENEALAAMFNRSTSTLADFEEAFDLDPEYYLGSITDSLQRTDTRSVSIGAAAVTTGGGGKEDWKTKRTEDKKRDLMARIEAHKLYRIVAGESTLHHKMSRSRFKTLLELLKKTSPSQAGVTEMWKFIQAIQALNHVANPESALENWAANIELGVFVNRRKQGDDRGDAFDGNYPGGSATPRTEELQEVDLIISRAMSGAEVPWPEVAMKLNQTQAHHARMTKEMGLKPEEFTDPHLEQWTHTPEGFVRDKPGKGIAASTSHQGSEVDIEKKLKAGLEKVNREDCVDPVVAKSVVDFMNEHHYNPGRPILVVSGENWTCYIRCVLHHFHIIGKYEAVMTQIGQRDINVHSGVVVGSQEENQIIAVITNVIGQQFYVHAIDAHHGGISLSEDPQGEKVEIVLTGAHFSLLL